MPLALGYSGAVHINRRIADRILNATGITTAIVLRFMAVTTADETSS
jgi:hypothetical protein